MNAEEIEKIINRISWGHKFIQITEKDGRERFLVIKALSLFFRNWIDFIYQTSYKKAIQSGIMTEKEMRKQLAETGAWTPDDDENLKRLHDSLVDADEKMKSGELNKRDKQIFKKLIKSTEDKIAEMEKYRDSALEFTCERYALEYKSKAVIFSSCYTETGERLWKDWDSFLEQANIELLSEITSKMYGGESLSIKQIREVARSPLWRNRWVAAKNTGDLFGCPIVELNDEQSILVYWSQAYDNVYESMDRPPDSVIENDEALDAWFKKQSDKSKSEQNKKKWSKDDSGLSSSIGKHGEVFLTPRTEEEIKEIYDMNDPLSRKFIHHQESKLEKFGVLSEQQMRNDPESRRVIGSKDAVFNIKRASDGFAKRNVTQILPGGTLQGTNHEFE